MKPLFIVAFIVTSISSPLWADGHNLVYASAPFKHDSGPTWQGFYAGGGLSGFGGAQTNIGNVAPENDLIGSMAAGYAGVNFQNGALVYGAEAAYALGSVYDADQSEYHFTDLLDVKARVGFGLGDTLIYGVAGWTNATWEGNSSHYSANGMNAGIGVDHLISDRFFIGAEYLFRDLEESNSEFVAPLSSVQIRAGLKF